MDLPPAGDAGKQMEYLQVFGAAETRIVDYLLRQTSINQSASDEVELLEHSAAGIYRLSELDVRSRSEG